MVPEGIGGAFIWASGGACRKRAATPICLGRVQGAGRDVMSQDCGTIRHGRGTGKHTAARGPRSQGAPYRVGVALVALLALLRDRKGSARRCSSAHSRTRTTVSRSCKKKPIKDKKVLMKPKWFKRSPGEQSQTANQGIHFVRNSNLSDVL